MEDGGVGELLVGCVGAGFDVGYLFDDVLEVMLVYGELGLGWGRRTRLCARKAASRG